LGVYIKKDNFSHLQKFPQWTLLCKLMNKLYQLEEVRHFPLHEVI